MWRNGSPLARTLAAESDVPPLDPIAVPDWLTTAVAPEPEPLPPIRPSSALGAADRQVDVHGSRREPFHVRLHRVAARGHTGEPVLAPLVGDRFEVRQTYLPLLFDRLVKKLQTEGKEAVPEIIELMDEYFLTKDDWDAIMELGVGDAEERLRVAVAPVAQDQPVALDADRLSHSAAARRARRGWTR